MKRDDMLKRLEQNIKAKFRYIPSSINSMEIISGSGPLIINSNLASDMFNIVCCESPKDISEVSNVITYFKNQQQPAAWWVGFQSDPSELKSRLERLGYKNEEVELAMVASLKSIASKANHELIIKRVNHVDALNDFISVISALIPDEANEVFEYFSRGKHIILHEDSRLKCFVGYIDENPVSTATVFLAEGVAGIFDIIALPEVRGRGVGSSMTIAAMQEGKQFGYEYATLTATNDARFVYEKLGFKALSEMCVYPIC